MKCDQSRTTIDEDRLREAFSEIAEELRKYSFHNDHIVRGPLCRLLGLIDLLKRESVNPSAAKLLQMILHELEQIENATIEISRNLAFGENSLEEIIDEFEKQKIKGNETR